MAHEIVHDIAWPYPGDEFPEGVGVIIQRTVLTGVEPARSVVHDTAGYWLASDGINDPNVQGASVLVCMHHLVERDPTVAPLVALASGTMAWRDNANDPWTIGQHAYPE